MSTDLLEGRIAELEQRARRFKLATTGIAGWENYFQSLIMQERDYFSDLLTEVIARLPREVLSEVKAIIDQALAMRSGALFSPVPAMCAATSSCWTVAH